MFFTNFHQKLWNSMKIYKVFWNFCHQETPILTVKSHFSPNDPTFLWHFASPDAPWKLGAAHHARTPSRALGPQLHYACNSVFYFLIILNNNFSLLSSQNWNCSKCCQLSTFELPLAIFLLKTQIWQVKIEQILIKVVNWQLFEQFQFWEDKREKLLFNIIRK